MKTPKNWNPQTLTTDTELGIQQCAICGEPTLTTDTELDIQQCAICGEPNATEECASCGSIVCEDCIVGDVCDDCWEYADEDDATEE